MSDARETILSAIRRATTPARAEDIAQEAAHLLANPDEIRSPVVDLEASFIAKATSERVTATVSEIASLGDLPAELDAYLYRVGLPPHVAVQPHPVLEGLSWGRILAHQTIAPDETVALSLARAAVAETGSVLIHSGRDAPFLMNFLPLHHLIVVPKHRILPHIEDAFALLGHAQSDQPRAMSLITGTSGTADIEAINIRGAHGPRFMHLFLCSEEF